MHKQPQTKLVLMEACISYLLGDLSLYLGCMRGNYQICVQLDST